MGQQNYISTESLLNHLGWSGKIVKMKKLNGIRIILSPAQLSNQEHQLIAIRFSSFSNLRMKSFIYGEGFTVIFDELTDFISIKSYYDELNLRYMAIFSGIPIVLSIFHLFFFFFYRKEILNLYYGIITLCFGFLNSLDFILFKFSDPAKLELLLRIAISPTAIAFIVLLLFAYEAINQKYSKNLVVFYFHSCSISNLVTN